MHSKITRKIYFDFADEGVSEQMMIRPIDQTDRKQVDAILVQQWYTLQTVAHGERIDPGSADGFYSCDGDEMIGLIAYRVIGKETHW